MKMLTATVKNGTMTPTEFEYFCFYLQMAWPCKQVDEGLELESIPVEDVYYYPKKTNRTVNAEEYLRRNIKDVCGKVLTHHKETEDMEKSYSVCFSYTDEPQE